MQRKKFKFTSKFLSSLTRRIHWNPALHCHPHQFLCAMFLLHHQRDSNFKENILINSNVIDLYFGILFSKYKSYWWSHPSTRIRLPNSSVSIVPLSSQSNLKQLMKTKAQSKATVVNRISVIHCYLLKCRFIVSNLLLKI